MLRMRYVLIGLFLAAFVFYLHQAYPTVSVGDSGEFITSSHILGLPHSPGFPTYVLLGKCATLLIPWANIGYRVNLLSAFCAALAISLFAYMLWKQGMGRGIALFGALLLAAGPALSHNAEASEVFSLHILFTVAIFGAALLEEWLLCAYLMGLGLGNHQNVLFLGPALLYLFLQKKRRESFSLLFLFGGLGFSIYGLLLVRAGHHPFLNWGDPETLAKLWRDISRADYGSLTLALGQTPDRTLANTLLQCQRLLRGCAGQMTWLGIAVAAMGWGLGFWKSQRWAVASMLAFLFTGPFFFVLGNLPFDAQSNGLLERFYIMPTLFLIIPLSFTLQWLAQKRHRWSWVVVAGAVAALLPYQAIAYSYRNDFIAYAYGRNNLRSLPPHATLIMDGGDDTFYTLAYLTQIEQRRSDVELHDRGGLVFSSLYGPDFRMLTHEEKESRRQQVEQALLIGDHPLYYSTMNESILAGHPLQQQGFLYTPRSTLPGGENTLWPLYDFRQVAPWDHSSIIALPDYRERALIPFYAFQRSLQAARESDWGNAMAFMNAAQAMGLDVLWLQPNINYTVHRWAILQYQAKNWDLARQWYHLLLIWNPHDGAAWTNLGVVEEQSGHPDQAIAAYQHAIEVNPNEASAHYNLAVMWWKQGRWDQVVAEMYEVMRIDPTNKQAAYYLQQARLRLPHS